MKTITHDLGYGPAVWHWPDGDNKLRSCFDMVKEVDEWIDLCPSFICAVQAGGAVGVWPIRLAQKFGWVYTFEAHPENYEALRLNIKNQINITAHHAPVSNNERAAKIHIRNEQRDNFGAGYILDDPQGIRCMTIDSLKASSCGLICLDVEGAELQALEGAVETIKRDKPLIVVEDKPLPQMSVFKRSQGAMGEWLKQFGYKLVKEVHWDKVYSC